MASDKKTVTTTTEVTTVVKPVDGGDSEVDVVFIWGEHEIPLGHVTMLKWLVKKIGSFEKVKVLLDFVERHGKVVSTAKKPASKPQ